MPLSRDQRRLVAVVCLLLLAGYAGALTFLVATANGVVDFAGRPLGTDFSNVYAAGTYVLDGEPAAPFDAVRQHAREKALFGEGTPFYGWHYPPFFLFVAAALALVPYGLALAVWQGATLVLWVATARRILPVPGTWLPALAFPAVFVNLGHGHNGFLTAGLLGSGLAVLDRRPALAGVLFGLVAYKPQFGLMIPLVLVATGRWRTFAAAAATVAALVLAATLAFGVEVWPAFRDGSEFTRRVVLEAGNTGWHKIQGVFSTARMWGAPPPLAYALQAAATLAVAVVLVRLWRGTAPFALKAAALCIGSLLATPYSLDYDLMVLGPALAFLAADALARTPGRGELALLALAFACPILTRPLADATAVPLGTAVMVALLALILARARPRAALDAAAVRPLARG